MKIYTFILEYQIAYEDDEDPGLEFVRNYFNSIDGEQIKEDSNITVKKKTKNWSNKKKTKLGTELERIFFGG